MDHAHTLAIYYHLLETVLRTIVRESSEVGSCLIWHKAVSSGAPVMGMPYRRLGSEGVKSKPPSQVRIRTLLLELFTHKRRPKGSTTTAVIVTPGCRDAACICPDCACYMPRTQLAKRAMAEMNPALKALRSERLAASARSMARRVLTPEQAIRIKTDVSTSGAELARQLKVPRDVVYKCRKDQTYREFSVAPAIPVRSPWAGLAP